ncbi:D-alanyl-D-alanine carboxypeptidase family protein [Amycolatopsis sp. lyj-346]|uniref:D-alanyl-D-alanine carboxypeptidase family protein n=1 Tax=Amycolatopsis sp. lyj-346 TaxID=2789289 RepID=UPI00397BAE57
MRATAQQRGVRLCAQDGKRSVAQQQREFAEAVRKFGARELASRYVLQPEESMHVQGIAVDVPPLSAAARVEREGAPWAGAAATRTNPGTSSTTRAT